MKKHILTFILIITALAAAGFLPGPDATAHASGAGETPMVETAHTERVDSAAVPPSPVVQVVVGFTGVLFGILTFLPLLDNHRYDDRHQGLRE